MSQVELRISPILPLIQKILPLLWDFQFPISSAIIEWNKLDSSLHNPCSIYHILQFLFFIVTIVMISNNFKRYLVGMSHLRENKAKHSFQKSTNSFWESYWIYASHVVVNNAHFSLLWEILTVNWQKVLNSCKTQVSLFGSASLNYDNNKETLNAPIENTIN